MGDEDRVEIITTWTAYSRLCEQHMVYAKSLIEIALMACCCRRCGYRPKTCPVCAARAGLRKPQSCIVPNTSSRSA